MARSKRETVVINKRKFYTSRYFASQTITTLRTAGRFLSDYKHLEGSKNPKLYTWSTIHRAITDFISSRPNMYSEENIEKSREKRRVEYEKEQLRIEKEEAKIEFQRAQIEGGFEEDSNLAYLNSSEPRNSNPDSFDASRKIKSEINRRKAEEFPIIALQHLLAVNGYAFDFSQYEKDLYTDISNEMYREPGKSRNRKQLAARKRLASNDSYLVEIDNDH